MQKIIAAADLKPGMTIIRVQARPLTRVFEHEINEVVLSVEPFTDRGNDYVRISTDTAYKTHYNLTPDRIVTVKIGA